MPMEEGQGSQNRMELEINRAVRTPPLAPPPGRPQHEMYIVQFPKDQVYRVPPRENALIVENHRNPATAKKKRICCCCCGPRLLLTLALVIISIIAILAMTLAILYFIFNPTGPTFAVTEFAVKNSNSPSKYDVSLRAKNPNQRLGIEYENGDVWLEVPETKVIARGKFPKLEQLNYESSQVNLELSGPNKLLPKGMGGDHKTNTTVALKLEMKLGVRVTTAGLKTWIMKAGVMCNFKVTSFGNDTRVLSQQCDTNFSQN
ncbi:hypothetical protein VNO77_00905 [Canavalia gladiata]|uniref:Late embryogenesis abundant protein LEA-2 subgroup domain-containing protein n=1 Tax=Canavalia gladiata TaxID=3824 RepID=A0AAN9MQY7_CANGL